METFENYEKEPVKEEKHGYESVDEIPGHPNWAKVTLITETCLAIY